MIKVLFAAAEGTPFIKTGGLADVIGSLPKALQQKDLDIRVVLPKYKTIPLQWKETMRPIKSIMVSLGWRTQYCGIEVFDYEGISFYFIDNEYYFGREGLYGYEDDGERFAFFSRAILEILPHIDFQPDILHCHDWHTALVSVFLKSHYKNNGFYQGIKTIYTIHNLMYQGVFPHSILADLLGLDDQYFTIDTLEYHGQINYMKGGIIFSDLLTTVSKTYAEEIQSPYFGETLDGLLRKRKKHLYGIVNGIDYDTYNPNTDPYIPSNYVRSLQKKGINKEKLQELLGLPVNKETPMVAIISRLVSSKGLDLIAHVLEDLMALDLQMVVLGTGEEKYENLFRSTAERYPYKLAARIQFDDRLAHQIYAASDLFLMPSRFEPCGIGQLIALRYGSIPVVRETGGLKDTVQSYNEYTQEGNGFSFTHYNAHDMLYTLRRALQYYQDKKIWGRIIKNAIRCDYSWKKSAEEYISLYQCLLHKSDSK
ncbi:starch synthase [Geosporobacter subterraneus DSM 17957]|uniref:Glycogen synthase n=1 Tax=Geosporobacter subterraneus DSM 17957 TaxID=1121919 RepID=A0A1M6P919_9FIRM|nr:glycogen synthase GlgA [Geosporobacter subterraneus]SHK04407.1 starch synthase [Geosporobacter subterraneus DSM 17957]